MAHEKISRYRLHLFWLAAGILLLTWLWPMFKVVRAFAPLLAVGVLIGLMFWQPVAEKLEKLFGSKFVRGIVIFLALVGLYGSIGWAVYAYLDDAASFMHVPNLAAAIILTFVGMLLAPLPVMLIKMFEPTGININVEPIARGVRGLGFIILIILCIRAYNEDPSRNGEAAGQAPPSAPAQPASRPQTQRPLPIPTFIVALTGHEGPNCYTNIVVQPGWQVTFEDLGGTLSIAVLYNGETRRYPVRPGMNPWDWGIAAGQTASQLIYPHDTCNLMNVCAFLKTTDGRQVHFTRFRGRNLSLVNYDGLPAIPCLDAAVWRGQRKFLSGDRRFEVSTRKVS